MTIKKHVLISLIPVFFFLPLMLSEVFPLSNDFIMGPFFLIIIFIWWVAIILAMPLSGVLETLGMYKTGGGFISLPDISLGGLIILALFYSGLIYFLIYFWQKIKSVRNEN